MKSEREHVCMNMRTVFTANPGRDSSSRDIAMGEKSSRASPTLLLPSPGLVLNTCSEDERSALGLCRHTFRSERGLNVTWAERGLIQRMFAHDPGVLWGAFGPKMAK